MTASTNDVTTGGATGSTTLRLRLAGVPTRLDLAPGHAPLAAELAVLWAHLLDPVDPAAPASLHRRYILPRPTGEPAPAETSRTQVIVPGEGAAYAVSGDLTRALIHHHLGRRILLHAGTVHHDHLGVLVLVGPSGAGKSTATLTLSREGRYLTDELTILDPENHQVTGYPKPISRRGDGAGKRDHSLAELGLIAAESAPRPGLVVLLSRDAAASARLERVPHIEALREIIAQSSSLWQVPGALSALHALLERTGGAVRAHYREATELAALLAAPPPPLRAEDAEELPEAEPVTDPLMPESASTSAEIDTGTETGTEVDARPGLLTAASAAQALAIGEEILVLSERRAVQLQGLPALAYALLREAGTLREDELLTRLVAEIGEHPEAGTLLAEALGILSGQGLLHRG